MEELISYSYKYPDIPYEITLFFSEIKKDPTSNYIVNKSVKEFCSYYKDKYNTKDLPQPRVIAKMCDVLCENLMMTVVHRGGVADMENSYLCTITFEEIIKKPAFAYLFKKRLNYVVFGFKYIYEDFKKYVLPIEHTDSKDDKHLGTGFLYSNGLVTARHCIDGAKKIAIKGIGSEYLKTARYKIPKNDLLDILFYSV